uniref:Uncharacterized protein n=1 Tax=Oryza meridionalis TaxID=40149 RepID=A0A0E0EDR3_9ORYZ
MLLPAAAAMSTRTPAASTSPVMEVAATGTCPPVTPRTAAAAAFLGKQEVAAATGTCPPATPRSTAVAAAPRGTPEVAAARVRWRRRAVVHW